MSGRVSRRDETARGRVRFDEAVPYAIPMHATFRGTAVREGLLIPGPAGYGDFCPFADYDDAECVPWLAAAVEQCAGAWPAPLRQEVPVNCIIPAVPPERAADMTLRSRCLTAKIKVASHPGSSRADLARVAAVREVLGPGGRIRVDANGDWDRATAVSSIRRLDRAARGLEYVEQPCRTVDDLAYVRRRVDVPIAADESIRLDSDPLRVAVAGAADVVVVKVAPLGGVHRTVALAREIGLPCVVSSAVETSVGLAAGLAAAAALPRLPYACGLGTALLLDGDVVAAEHVVRPIDGRLAVSSARPAVRPELLNRYLQTDAGRASWWRRRMLRVLDLLVRRKDLPGWESHRPTT